MKAPDLTVYHRKLPHWRLDGSIYFVTWRLARNQPSLHPGDRTLVVDAVRYFNGQRYELFACVVMDDHVHVLVRPLDNHSLHQILHSWKLFTASALRRLQERPVPVWQYEYFERIVRDEADLIEKAQYTLGNSVKR